MISYGIFLSLSGLEFLMGRVSPSKVTSVSLSPFQVYLTEANSVPLHGRLVQLFQDWVSFGK